MNLRALALTAVACFAPACKQDDMSKLLKKYGYSEVMPASKALPPGTVIWIQNDSPLVAGIVCTQEMSMGANLPLMSADAANGRINKTDTFTFELPASYMATINGILKTQIVKTINVTLTNVHAVTVTDVDAMAGILQRSSACQAAIDARLKSGFKVTMVQSALEADGVYDIQLHTDSGLSATAQAAVLSQVSLSLGLNGTTGTETQLMGTGLYWGITDDNYYAHASQAPKGMFAREFVKQHRRLAPIGPMVFSPQADAR